MIVKRHETDGASGTSSRYQSSPPDCHLLWWNNSFFVGRADDLLSATGEINPSHTLSALMLGRKTDKGNGAEWQKKESLTHLLTWWSTAAICPYLRGAGAMEEVHWPTEGSRGLQSWRGRQRWKNNTIRPGSQHSTIHAVYISPHKYWLHTHAISEL